MRLTDDGGLFVFGWRRCRAELHLLGAAGDVGHRVRPLGLARRGVTVIVALVRPKHHPTSANDHPTDKTKPHESTTGCNNFVSLFLLSFSLFYSHLFIYFFFNSFSIYNGIQVCIPIRSFFFFVHIIYMINGTLYNM